MAERSSEQGGLVVRDIDISFVRWVMIMVKVAIASIPAAIIISIVYMIIFGVLGSVFGMGGWMMR